MQLIRFLFSRVFWINVLAAIVLSVLLIYGAILYLDKYTLHGESIAVPDFTGFHLTELDDFMGDKELSYVIMDSVYDVKKPRGVVIDQTPLPDSRVKPNRKIYLTVNSILPPMVKFPLLNDLTLRQAKARLETYGLLIDSLIYKPSECTQCIIGALYEGEPIEQGASIPKGKEVSLIVGGGESDESISVPHLYGRTQIEVEEWLIEKGLNLGLARFDETVETTEDSVNARVYQQIPAYGPNAFINLGRSIDVFLTADSTKVPMIELWEGDTANTVTP